MSSKNSIDQFLIEVNNKVRLSDFIGQFVNLREKGNSFIGKCPFHNENTPSFNVNNEKSLFYCFGCKTGGNILNFITKYKNLSFMEGVSFLAKYSGVLFSLEKKKISSGDKIILEVLRQSNNFFQECLKNNKFALDYISSRGVSKNVINDFKVGFCPSNIKLLTNHLEANNFNFDQILKTDLLIKNTKNEYFGRFGNRITFPIYNFVNELVGFGGRSIMQSKIKYINSQENPVFKKSNVLFGLRENLDKIRKEKEVLLVEGYMDVIRLYEEGVNTAVSSLGTTLSETQLKKMWQLSDIPFVCFDGDDAGINASENVALKVLKFLVPGKSLKFIKIPDKDDPDSYLKKNRKEGFVNLKSESKDLSLMVWEIIEKSIETNTPEFLASLDFKINDVVKKIENEKVSREYLRYLKSMKDKYIWDKNRISTNSGKFNKVEKVIENLNEKIFIFMILTEDNLISQFEEEIFRIRLSKEKLEFKKDLILKNFSNHSETTETLISKFKDYDAELFLEIQSLGKTHLLGLSSKDKIILFKQILNNLRLPILINERKLMQKEISSLSDNLISDKLIRKYNEISQEIKNIQNKDIE